MQQHIYKSIVKIGIYVKRLIFDYIYKVPTSFARDFVCAGLVTRLANFLLYGSNLSLCQNSSKLVLQFSREGVTDRQS